MVVLAMAIVAPQAGLQAPAAPTPPAHGTPGATATPGAPLIPGSSALGGRSILGPAAAPAAGEHAEAPVGNSGQVVKVSAIPARRQLLPGSSIAVAIILDIQPPWHLWTAETQAANLPEGFANFAGAIHTEISVAVKTPGIDAATGFIQWPAYHAFTADIGEGPQRYAVYEGRSVAFLPLVVAPDAAPGARRLEITVDLQACIDQRCLMPDAVTVPIDLEIVSVEAATRGGAGAGASGADGQADVALFTPFDHSVFQRIASGDAGASVGPRVRATSEDLVQFNLLVTQFSVDPRGAGIVILVGVAFLGGLLLNLTPCVLPIVPLKIMGLVQSAETRGRRLFLGAVMSFGVFFFFLVLGLAVAILRVDAISILFQYPLALLALGLFIMVMAFAMSGFFSVGLPDFVYAFEPKHETVKGSFFVGVLTAVLSTPCAGPMIFSSMSYALKIDSRVLIIVMFVAMGVGMALPYFVLSAFPGLVKHVPRAGPASELVKQVMGLLLLAAGAFFFCTGIAGLLDWRTYEYYWVVAGVAAAAGAWLAYRTFRITSSPARRAIFGSLGALIVLASLAGGQAMASQVDSLQWTLYSPAAEKAALADGKIVVIKFTAHWCISCKVLEKAMLTPDDVVARLSRRDVVLLKVDITDRDDKEQQARLNAAGSITIPLLQVLAPDGVPTMTSDVYTGQQVIDAVNEAARVPLPVAAR